MFVKPEDIKQQNKELSACSFHHWYSNFEKITIPSKFIKIPEAVVKYLQDEIIILPNECYAENDNTMTGYDGEDTEIIDVPEFPDFSKEISEIIKDLSGAVFIKTNWHSPKDALWITAGQTLKVKDITDAYQLLKASSIIKNDLNNFCIPFNGDNAEYYLIMKEWQEIHPGTEFRCFVKNRKLIAISPRDWPNFHKHILTQKKDIVSDIVTVFKEKIKFQFPLENFVFDVVRACKDKVCLLDFSPFNENFTDALAFEWDELYDEYFNKIEEGEEDDPEIRYLSHDCGIQPNRRNNYGIPQDILDMFNNPDSSRVSSNISDLLAFTVQEALRIEDNGGC